MIWCSGCTGTFLAAHTSSSPFGPSLPGLFQTALGLVTWSSSYCLSQTHSAWASFSAEAQGEPGPLQELYPQGTGMIRDW